MSSTGKPTVVASERALELVADRWTMWLLVELDGTEGSRFTDLAAQPGLSRRVLTERLARLVDERIIAREQYSVRPPRYRYRLTDRGIQLQRLAVALVHVAGGGLLVDDPVASGARTPSAPRVRAGARDEHEAEPVGAASPAAPAEEEIAALTPGAHPSDQLLAADPDAAWAIYQSTVAPLLRYDEHYRTGLTETLEAYLACDASVSVTAARLYAHRHTVRYRLGRVRELTGLDVDTVADRERLVLGLRALGLFRRSGRELP